MKRKAIPREQNWSLIKEHSLPSGWRLGNICSAGFQNCYKPVIASSSAMGYLFLLSCLCSVWYVEWGTIQQIIIYVSPFSLIWRISYPLRWCWPHELFWPMNVSRSSECACTVWFDLSAFYVPILYVKKSLPSSHGSFNLGPRMKDSWNIPEPDLQLRAGLL